MQRIHCGSISWYLKIKVSQIPGHLFRLMYLDQINDLPSEYMMTAV